MVMKTTHFLISFLLLSSIFLAIEGRRLNASKVVSSPDVVKDGPSLGEGHKITNLHTLEGIKESGPSPGEGHKYVNGIKDSGPSPGAGH
ncbi:hypothetical protein ACS0TY_006274 [Phlomoides rotata]